LEELEKRLALLRENVASSLKEKKTEEEKNSVPDSIPEDSRIDEPSPFPTPSLRGRPHNNGRHMKIPSMEDWRGFMARLSRRNASFGEEKSYEVVADVDELAGDTDARIIHDSKQVKKIAEADSIQRALVDQYRTAKLLHNFAIMNYTGFVKIVKKHDKTLPHRKGHFKSAVHASNICNEGKAVETLASRLERTYANWFCEGNLREAYAQLLPKRGDGLETDWSQLR
jgi:hypothetical protein